VALLTVNDAAGVEPNATAVAPVRLAPVIVTVVPPAVGPPAGLTELTVGPVVYVYLSPELSALVPPGFVTMMSTVPALSAGAIAVIWVAVLTENEAAVEPNITTLAPMKFVPVIVTDVPPPVGPALGLTPETVGVAKYVYLSALLAALVPPAVVTARSTVPALSAGEVAVIWVMLLIVKLVAAVDPNVTAVAPLRLVPVIVTVVPPAVDPPVGLTLDTVGGAT
jgi:hypothetical protein